VEGTFESGEPAVVYILNQWGSACTATVIAPRVAVTAKHCIQGMRTRGWSVFVGPGMNRFIDQYGVVDVRTTSGQAVENADIAVLILNRDFAHGAKRWAFAPLPDFNDRSNITVIGYGLTSPDRPGSSGTKYRRDGQVLLLGPQPAWQLGDSEFMTIGENACQGDSGGPVLFQDILVGVISRGEMDCQGIGYVTRVSSFYDLISQALADTGACVPQSFEVCNGADDNCGGGADEGLGPSCGCANGNPPSPETCDGVDNDCNNAIDDLEACGCRDGNPPSREVCDGIDNDCNGHIDEVCTPLGEPCTSDEECSTGYCALVGDRQVCTAPCTGGGVNECPKGSFCEAEACGPGLCRPDVVGGTLTLGAECALSGDCESRFCAPSADNGTFRCSRPCQPDQLSCFATEVCQPLAEACGRCTWAAKASGARGFGEPCQADSECLSGACYSDAAGQDCGPDCNSHYCTVPCNLDGSCPAGGHCRGGFCVRGPYSQLGEACIADDDCGQGACVSRDNSLRCAVACQADGSCDSGFLCLDGVCWPEQATLGETCAAEDQPCLGGLCTAFGGQILCLTACETAGDCPGGLLCVPADQGGTRGQCITPKLAAGHLDQLAGQAGCSCRAGQGTPAQSALWWSLLLAMGWALGRHGRRRHPQAASSHSKMPASSRR
jgi:hypothetical protein